MEPQSGKSIVALGLMEMLSARVERVGFLRPVVPDGGVGGTNTIAYCRDVGPTTVVLRAVDTSGNRSGPSNELNITC